MTVTIDERFLKILSKQSCISVDEIDRKHKLIEDLDLDSLDVVELVMDVEENFGIEIPDEDYEKILTVENAINYIKGRVG